MPRLSTLLVSLEANTAELKKGLADAQGRLQAFEGHTRGILSSVRKIGQQMNAALAKDAVTAIARFVADGAAAVAEIGNMAKGAQVALEPFSKLAYVARLNGISNAELAGSFKALNANIAQAATGSGQQASLFKALGVSVKDASGNVRSADKVMLDLANRFQSFEDGPAKAKLLMAAFGEEGRKLAPVLEQLAGDGFARAGDEAVNFGAVLSGPAFEAALGFNRNLKRLKEAFDGISQQVAAAVAPAFNVLAERLFKSKEGADFLKSAVMVLTGAFKALLSAGTIVGAIFEVVGKTLARVGSIVADVFAGRFAQAGKAVWDFKKTLVEDLVEAGSGATKSIEQIWTSTSSGAEVAGQKGTENAQKILNKFEQAKQPMKEFADIVAKTAKNFDDVGDAAKKAADRAADIRKLAGDIFFEKQRAIANIGTEAGGRLDRFNAIGGDPGADEFALATRGLHDFEDAIQTASREAVRQQELIGEARYLEKTGSEELARKKYMEAEASGQAAAHAWGAADAFEEVRRSANEAALALKAQLAHAVANAGGTVNAGLSTLFSKMGASGEIAQSAMQGFQMGGIWGALVVVIIELMSKMDKFGDLMDQSQESVDKLLTDLSSGLNSLIGGFMKLMSALQPLKDLIHDILNPVLMVIGDLLGIVALALKPLAPIFKIIGKIFSMVGLTILGVVWAIGKAINAIAQIFDANAEPVDTDAIEDQMEELIQNIASPLIESAKKAGKKLEEAADPKKDDEDDEDDGWHAGEVAAEEGKKGKGTFKENTGNVVTLPAIPYQLMGSSNGGVLSQSEFAALNPSMATDAIQAAYKDYVQRLMQAGTLITREAFGALNGLTGQALEEEYQKYLETLPDYKRPTQALDEFGKTIEKVNASLSNTPSGYKLALARFNATAGIGPAAQSRDMRGVEMRGVTMYFTIKSEDPEAVWDVVKRRVEREAFNMTGSTQGVGSGPSGRPF